MGSFRLRLRRRRWWETGGPAPSQPFSRQEFSKVNRGKRAGCRRSNGNETCYLLRKSSKERILSCKEQSRVQVSLDVRRVWSKCCCVVTSSQDIKEKGRWRRKAKRQSLGECTPLTIVPPSPLPVPSLPPFFPSPSLSVSLPSFFPLLSFSVGNTTQAGPISRIWQNLTLKFRIK